MASIYEGKQKLTRREFIMASSTLGAMMFLSPATMAIQPSKEVALNGLDQKVKENMVFCRHCAQTSFLTLTEHFALDGPILKALTPFPGIALRGETCGAVVGSLMALGLVYGRDRLDDMAGYTASLGPAQKFCQRFEAELGSTMCGDIVEAQCGRRFNLADPVEFAEFQVIGAEKCPAVVQTGVRIGAEILSDKVSPNAIELDQLDQKVQEYLAFSGHCAQTSFLTLTEYFALDGPILKALTPFPGIALRGETCGAVVGSLMAMGLVYGRDRLDDWPGYTASLAPSQRFCSAFEEQLGGTMCGDIIEAQFGRRADLRNPTDVAELQAAGFLEKCTEVVRTGVRIAAEIIVDKGGPTAVEMKNNLPTTWKELKAID